MEQIIIVVQTQLHHQSEFQLKTIIAFFKIARKLSGFSTSTMLCNAVIKAAENILILREAHKELEQLAQKEMLYLN